MSDYKHIQKNKDSKLAIGIIAFVMIILIGVISVRVSGLYVQSQAVVQQKMDIEKEIASEKSRGKYLMDYQEYMETDDYIEQLAREQLNLIKEDEIKMVPIDD